MMGGTMVSWVPTMMSVGTFTRRMASRLFHFSVHMTVSGPRNGKSCRAT